MAAAAGFVGARAVGRRRKRFPTSMTAFHRIGVAFQLRHIADAHRSVEVHPIRMTRRSTCCTCTPPRRVQAVQNEITNH